MPDFCLSAAGNITLKLVQNGTFAMGTDSTDTSNYQNIASSKPKHNVTISKPYYLGIYVVTQEQWIAVNGSNPSRNQGWESEIADGADMSRHPIEYIKYSDILGFIQALNDAEHDIILNGEQYVYSLPSEAEFEYAARGGTTSERYFCEDNASQADCKQSALDYEWFNDNSHGGANNIARHQEVGTKLPNPWGFYDMYGNMQEWLLDIGNSTNSCKYLQEDITDPVCNDNSGQLVRRIGYYYSDFKGLYTAGLRGYSSLDRGGVQISFRLALVAKSVRDNMTKFANGTIIQ